MHLLHHTQTPRLRLSPLAALILTAQNYCLPHSTSMGNIEPSQEAQLHEVADLIDTTGAVKVDFFHGCGFADFRTTSDVKQGRDPFYADSEKDAMRPWMTPLSMMGNHQSIIIYSARKHCIWILDQTSGRSSDHGLLGQATDVRQAFESKEEKGESKQDTARELIT